MRCFIQETSLNVHFYLDLFLHGSSSSFGKHWWYQQRYHELLGQKFASFIWCIKARLNLNGTERLALREKCPNTKFFLVRMFLYSGWIRRLTTWTFVFSPNAEKYGPEKAPYLDTFHAVLFKWAGRTLKRMESLLVLFLRCGGETPVEKQDF